MNKKVEKKSERFLVTYGKSSSVEWAQREKKDSAGNPVTEQIVRMSIGAKPTVYKSMELAKQELEDFKKNIHAPKHKVSWGIKAESEILKRGYRVNGNTEADIETGFFPVWCFDERYFHRNLEDAKDSLENFVPVEDAEAQHRFSIAFNRAKSLGEELGLEVSVSKK